jgi:hypothetical protein
MIHVQKYIIARRNHGTRGKNLETTLKELLKIHKTTLEQTPQKNFKILKKNPKRSLKTKMKL